MIRWEQTLALLLSCSLGHEVFSYCSLKNNGSDQHGSTLHLLMWSPY